MELTEPLEAAVVAVAQSAELAMPKRTSLPSMLPPGFVALCCLVNAQRRERRVAALFRPDSHRDQHDEDDGHGRQERPALARVAHHLAEGVAQRSRDQQDRQQLQEVGQRRGILERMRRVDVEEAAAVGAQLLDGDLRGRRADGQHLLA